MKLLIKKRQLRGPTKILFFGVRQKIVETLDEVRMKFKRVSIKQLDIFLKKNVCLIDLLTMTNDMLCK